MKKSILIIHDSMGGGGAERVLATLLKHLDRSRFDITLLLIYREGPFLDSIPADIEVLNLFGTYSDLSSRLVTHYYGIRAFARNKIARRRLKGRHFDVTVSFMEGPVAQLHSMLIDLADRNYTWVHNNLSIGRWYDFWFRPDEERQFYRQVDKVAFVSQGALEAFDKTFESAASRQVIYNPVDSKALRDGVAEVTRPDDGIFRIINIGRLVDQKKHERLIEAARLLKDRGHANFIIDILGKGPREAELKALARDRGVDDVVNFAGFIANPFPRLKQADLFCMTSAHEGYPMVITETLSIGTPVVSTPVNGVTEMLAHGGGILTDETPESIADALERLINNPTELERLARETVASTRQFDLKNILDLVESFIGD